MALIVAAAADSHGLHRAGEDLPRTSWTTAARRSEAIIESVLKEHGGFLQYHDLKTRQVGDQVYAEMHMCVLAETTMAEAHELTESIENALGQKIPGIVVNIHMETEKECVLTISAVIGGPWPF